MELLTQAAFYVPSVLAHVAALVVAVILAPRARMPAALLAGGTALQLLASCGSYGATAWTTWAYTDGGMSAVSISAMHGGVGLLVSLLRAVGEVVVVAAVGAAVLRAGKPAVTTGTDPYGFPEERRG